MINQKQNLVHEMIAYNLVIEDSCPVFDAAFSFAADFIVVVMGTLNALSKI